MSRVDKHNIREGVVKMSSRQMLYRAVWDSTGDVSEWSSEKH